MKTKNKSWNLQTINRRINKINPKPQYQRTGVWSEKRNQFLIDSLLRGYDIPKIYLSECSIDDGYLHEVVDGQQRLRAIWGFYKDEYALSDLSRDLPIGNQAGKKYSELSEDVKDKLDLMELLIVIIEEATDEEIRDLFSRLQDGVPLNPPERRNAMSGNMRDFIDYLAINNKVFRVVSKEDKRFLYADWVAHVVCLELSKGSTQVKAQDLQNMYIQYKDFDKNSTLAKKVKYTLNYMADAFKLEITPEMNIKWGFVDLYLLISLLSNEYGMQDKNLLFGTFYIGFENERRENMEDPSELIDEREADEWAKDLYDYIQAFRISGGEKNNINIRNNVYTRKLFREVENLVRKDSKRLFDENQKIVMWRRDNKKCKECGKPVEFDEMHADHIVPHSTGGLTTIENGQTLCVQCNLKKGSK